MPSGRPSISSRSLGGADSDGCPVTLASINSLVAGSVAEMAGSGGGRIGSERSAGKVEAGRLAAGTLVARQLARRVCDQRRAVERN